MSSAPTKRLGKHHVVAWFLHCPETAANLRRERTSSPGSANPRELYVILSVRREIGSLESRSASDTPVSTSNMATSGIAASPLINISASILSQDMKTPLQRDEQGGKWITPGKPRKSRLPADPNPELHVVIVHLPVLPAGAAAQLLDILPAFLQAAQLPAHTCADGSLHFRQNNRLAALRTHHEAIVNRLLRITSITLQNTSRPVHSYLAAPNNSCRGVIRGIASGTTPDEIINELESYQADILHATNHYNSCVEYGHRTLACPGNQRRCPPCSTTEPHPCTSWFALLELAVWFSNRALGPK
ncbi:hypothetical protein HPB47_003778 [Ixodes persulcatus]|uniref:Uncharacterized protein n=1 Tax=Ixodes persulcatus TaxID=34615 RepID=A0AC60PHI4_IXOPE|nr:hypothetical protein HPB47_003778 [Ixodes persulcatus]